METLVKSF